MHYTYKISAVDLLCASDAQIVNDYIVNLLLRYIIKMFLVFEEKLHILHKQIVKKNLK